MEVSATAKFVRMSPKKIRPLLSSLRNQPAETALTKLKFHPSKSARLLYQAIKSAASNAGNNYNLKLGNLKIKALTVDEGPSFKRYWFRSHGAADRLLKRTSHIKVILSEIKPTLVKKPVAAPIVTAKPAGTQAAPEAKSEAVVDKPGKPTPGDKTAKRAVTGMRKIFTRRTTNK
ncbi:MAG: 50S ribosomal protein L22 [bacterium]